MENMLLKTLSPQAAKVYEVLLKNTSLTAKEIGQKVGVISNTIYRNIKELQKLGLIEVSNKYPITYKAKTASAAVSFFTSLIRQDFYQAFGLTGEGDENLNITFFQTRNDMLKLSEKDINNSKKQVNIIISGHSVPAELILAQKLAVDRGVRIRKLIQNKEPENIKIAKYWQKNGIEIRYTPIINARIVVIDGQITQFGSYKKEKQPESYGVRFDYAPFARLMDEMFEQKWHAGKMI